MVSLKVLTATAVLSFAGFGRAGLVDPLAIRTLENTVDDLLEVRDVAPAVVDDTPVIAAPSSPVVLQPLRTVHNKISKRDRKAALALKAEETLYWGGSDGTVAAMKIEMPGKYENIVNLEAIDDMVEAVHCPRQGNSTASATGRLSIKFAEEADYDDAEDIWGWVNKDAGNHFTLVVGAGDCGWNTERIVYQVRGLIYNDEKETAIFDVERQTWKQAFHTYDLTVGKAAKESAEVTARRMRLARRGIFDKIGNWFKDTAGKVKDFFVGTAKDVADTVKDVAGDVVDAVGSVVNPDLNPEFSIPFSSDFSNKGLSFSMNGVEASAFCVECYTKGAFDIEARFKVKWFKVEQAWIEASTKGIEAKAKISLTLRGDLTKELASKELPLFKISPAGIAIPGVLTIGPTVSVNLGAEISAIKGGLSITVGGTATIPPSSSRLDFLDKSKTKSTGWKPEFKSEPFQADVFIQAGAAVYLSAAVGIELSALESGFTADLSARLPYLAATLKAIHSFTCTACGDFQNGIQGSLSLGTSITVALKQKVLGVQKTLWSLSFIDVKLPEIAGFCKGFGPQGAECLAP